MSEFRSQLITKPFDASRSTARVSAGREGSLQTVSGQGVAHGSGHRELNAAEVDESDIDLEAIGHATDAVVEDCVAGDPEDSVPLGIPAEGEADHVSGELAAEGRAVAAGRGG